MRMLCTPRQVKAEDSPVMFSKSHKMALLLLPRPEHQDRQAATATITVKSAYDLEVIA